jgi:hypothetical protein
MKIRIINLFIVILILFSDGIFAQTDTSSKLPDLIPYRKGDKWGFCLPAQAGDKDKKIIIPCNYNSVDFFNGGVAIVSKQN